MENGICDECKIKLNDDTIKPVSPCPICKRLVCAIHSRSKLVNIPDFKDDSKRLKEFYEIIREDYVDDTGHSCMPYTLTYWKEYDLEKERKQQREKNQMDGFGYLTDEEIKNMSERYWFELQKRRQTIDEDIEEENVDVSISRGGEKRKEGFWERLKKRLIPNHNK